MRLLKLFFLAVLTLTLAAPVAPRQAGRPAPRKPNIVFILGDDLGYCDVSMYGCRDIPTPNIDSVAKAGVKFTNGYVSSPVCSPSRAGLLTGRYQQRFGFEFNTGPLQRALAEPEMGLPTSEITLAQVLKQAGYATGMVGKWHLGMHEKFHPQKRGFDEYFGFLFGANMYIDPDQPGVKSADPEGVGVKIRTARNPIVRGQTVVEEKEYLTEAFARESVAFIERHRNEPFFLYAPFNAPHTPLQATQKYLDRFPHVKDEKRRIYMAMVSALDDAVGAILNKLRETGLEKDTLVVFLSDNGCATYTGACTNDPLRLGKLTHFEGGFRVPFAIRFPGRIKAGSVYDKPISSLDLFPTAVALAGAKMPADRAYDGLDLLPYLTGKKKTAPHDVLCWRNGDNAAVRKGNWKLFKGGDHFWLYDLSKDVGEQQNVAEKYPAVVTALKQELAAWNARMKQPLWPCRPTGEVFEVVLDGVKLKLCI
ncbi:MAG: sulfatase-like hydrolase/transferase [Acidobacteria bacterium]|nr:sulfatase-like hydrolase/transferase [Acidobacteriota bacterium]MBI3425435.1 sulfatase-like hydrolase/transferase [Acidobacteriota bacterium]